MVRHGETDWNVDKRIQGHIDIPLNTAGLAPDRMGRPAPPGADAGRIARMIKFASSQVP
jgi:broad specificity phosphatase PhoE